MNNFKKLLENALNEGYEGVVSGILKDAQVDDFFFDTGKLYVYNKRDAEKAKEELENDGRIRKLPKIMIRTFTKKGHKDEQY